MMYRRNGVSAYRRYAETHARWHAETGVKTWTSQTLIGIVVGVGLVVLAIFLGEGVNGFKPFLNAEAVLIVMGGTFCALLVNYPIGQVFSIFKVLKKVLTSSGEDTSEIVTTFVNLPRKVEPRVS